MSGPADKTRDRVAVGRIGRAHGIRGQMHIGSYTERPEDVAAYGPVQTGDGRQLDLTVVSVNKADVTVRVAGVIDRNGAEALRGQELFVPRAALPETASEEYYHHDPVGLRAVSVAGRSDRSNGFVPSSSARRERPSVSTPFARDSIAA